MSSVPRSTTIRKARTRATGVSPRSGLLLALFLFAGASAARADDASSSGDGTPAFQLLSIESLKDKRVFPGKLFLPLNASGPVPLIVMIPGTDGVDGRQEFHRSALLSSGIATLELDTKTGVFTSAEDRPEAGFFMPIVFSALRDLRAMSEIDPQKIAIMGWSAGATVSLQAAQDKNRRLWLPTGQSGFTAHIGLYGGCSRTRDLINVPILILVGDKDTFGANKGCRDFAREHRQVTLKIYPGVRHGFDIPGVNKGRGERVMEWNEAAAIDARIQVGEFLTEAFAR